MRFFGVFRNEEDRLKVALTWAMLVLLSMGHTIGWAAIHAMLVKRMGVEYLPYTYIGISILGVAGSSVYLLFADRVRRDRVLMLFTLCTGATLLVSRCCISGRFDGNEDWSWPLVLFFALVFGAEGLGNSTLTMQVWTIINDIVNPIKGKRLYPVIATGLGIGCFVGGLAISGLVDHIGTANLVIIWAASILSVIPLTLILKKHFGFALRGAGRPGNAARAGASGAWRQNLAKGLRAIALSPLVRILAGTALAFWVVGSLLDFQYTRIMSEAFRTEKELSSYYGYYAAAFSLTGIAIQIFFTGSIIRRLGIGPGLCLLPLTTMAGFGAILASYSFWPGLLLRYLFDVVGTSIQGNAFQLSFNAFPAALRGRMRGFIDGVVNPVGGVVGGLLILGLKAVLSEEGAPGNLEYLTYAGIILAGAWLGIALFANRAYIGSILQNLGHKDKASRLDAIQALGERGNRHALDALHRVLAGDDDEARIKALQTLPRIGCLESLRRIDSLLDHRDQRIRAAAVQSIRGFEHLGREPFLTHHFQGRMEKLFTTDPSSPVRAEAASFLVSLQRPRDAPRFIASLLQNPDPQVRCKVMGTLPHLKLRFADFIVKDMLADNDPMVRAQAIQCLWRYEEYRAMTGAALAGLLEEKESASRYRGLESLIKVNAPCCCQKLLSLLDDNAQDVRLLASLSLLLQPDAQYHDQARAVFLQGLADPRMTPLIRQNILPYLAAIPDNVLDGILFEVLRLPQEHLAVAKTALVDLKHWLVPGQRETYA